MLSNITILIFLKYIFPLLRDFRFEKEDGNHRILLLFKGKTEPMLCDIFERKVGEDSFYPIYSGSKTIDLIDHTLVVDLNFIDKESDSQFKICVSLGNDEKFYSSPFIYNKKQENFAFVK
jgi:hypothetical protein